MENIVLWSSVNCWQSIPRRCAAPPYFGCGCLGVNIYRPCTPRGSSAELEVRGSPCSTCTFTNGEDLKKIKKILTARCAVPRALTVGVQESTYTA